MTGIGRNTIYKVLKEELNYLPYNRLVTDIPEMDLQPLMALEMPLEDIFHLFTIVIETSDQNDQNDSFKAFKAVISFQRYNLTRMDFRTILRRLSTRRNNSYLNKGA